MFILDPGEGDNPFAVQKKEDIPWLLEEIHGSCKYVTYDSDRDWPTVHFDDQLGNSIEYKILEVTELYDTDGRSVTI